MDRATERRRDAGWLEARLADPHSGVVLVAQGAVLVAEGEAPRAVLPTLGEVAGSLLPSVAELRARREAFFLGLEGERAWFAVEVETARAERESFVDFKPVAGRLPEDEAALLAYARGLTHWHAQSRFCGRCGSATRPEDGGHLRRCVAPGCATEIFPRTDPAIIVLVHDHERCLLGRNAAWPPRVYSTLAGFVEPGESLEEAVAREVFEEAGVHLARVAYHSSQPWPFPQSLMVGFHAYASSSELTIDRDELEDARWWTRETLRGQLERKEIFLPPRVSISRRLVDDWLSERAAAPAARP